MPARLQGLSRRARPREGTEIVIPSPFGSATLMERLAVGVMIAVPVWLVLAVLSLIVRHHASGPKQGVPHLGDIMVAVLRFALVFAAVATGIAPLVLLGVLSGFSLPVFGIARFVGKGWEDRALLIYLGLTFVALLSLLCGAS